MKKLLLLSLISLFFITAQAQNWCPPGATWYYRNLNTNPATYFDGSLEPSYTSTITINGIVCKELTGTYYGRSQYLDDPNSYTVTNYVTYRTYEANKVAYLYNVFDQKFDTIADFNAHIGDSWSYALYNSFCTDQNIPKNKVTVYDTGHVVINGFTLKKLVVSPPADTIQNVFIERIGGMPGFLFMQQDCALDGSTLGNFSCYSDEDFVTYKKPGIVNCNFNTVSIQEQTLAGGYIKLYPNPNNGTFKVEVTQPCAMEIFNNLGASVYKSVSKNSGITDVDISTLPAGVYYLRAFNETGNAFLKVVRQ
jgi:hypothetical protein